MSFPPNAFSDALAAFAAHERMDPLMLLCKLTEESGELAEAVLVKQGYKPHKVLPGDASIDEAADVLMCLLLVLSRLYPDVPPADLSARIAASADHKLARYLVRQAGPTER